MTPRQQKGHPEGSPTPTHPQGGQPPPPRDGANPPWLSPLIGILTLISSGLPLFPSDNSSLDWAYPVNVGIWIIIHALEPRKVGVSRWWFVGRLAVLLLIRYLLT
jgi:hypothetical protein